MLSRVADSLYWMSRYLERAEHLSRLVAVRIDSMMEQSEVQAVRSLRRFAAAAHLPVPSPAEDVFARTAADAIAGRGEVSSVLSAIQMARDNARQVREQISADMWERLNLLYIRLKGLPGERAVPHTDFLQTIINDLYLFTGVTDVTMRHGEGWHFIQLGRFVERAQLLARLLDVHFGQMPEDVPADLEGCDHQEWVDLLRACSGFEAYCKVHTAEIRAERIAEFLIFDPLFPRSLRFAVNRIDAEIGEIGRGAENKGHARLERLTGRLKAKLDFGQIEEVIERESAGYLADVQRACERIDGAVRATYVEYDVGAIVAA